MIVIKKILVPTDFSDASAPAVAYAMSLAKNHDADLIVVHVLRTDAIKGQFTGSVVGEGVLSPAGGAPRATGPSSLEELFEAKKQLLSRFIEQRVGAELARPVKIKPVIRYGNVAEAILATAKEQHCDLIVMTRQASRLSSLFRRKFTERVARGAPCPVLFVHPGAEVTTDKDERVPLTSINQWAA
ncbi:MAG: universal stress protein [Candidatus Binatia bacterium]